MKYCPYCGAPLVDSAVLFCAECGKHLPETEAKKESEEQESEELSESQEQPEMEAGYDGYYEDVVPVDDGWKKEGVDQQLIKKVLLVVAGLILAVIVCMALMCFL